MSDQDQSLEARLAALLAATLTVAPPGIDDDLLATGIIDSLALVDLLLRLETELGVVVPVDALEPEDFRTVRAIAALVRRHGA